MSALNRLKEEQLTAQLKRGEPDLKVTPIMFELDVASKRGCDFILPNGLKTTLYRLNNPKVKSKNLLFMKIIMAETLHFLWNSPNDYLLRIQFKNSTIDLIFSHHRLREVLPRLISKDLEDVWDCFWVFLNGQHIPSHTRQGRIVLEAVLRNVDPTIVPLLRQSDNQMRIAK